MSTLEVNIQSDISIDQLCALREQGFSVQRSAHIGNMQPYNMTLAAAGVPMLLVDHTVTGIDKTYRPEQQLRDLTEVVIAPLGALASRTMSDDGAGYLDEVHTKALQDAVPQADIETTTAYTRRNESVYRAVIDAALSEMPEIFSRIVTDNRVQKTVPKTAASRALALVQQIGVMQLNDNPREGSAVMMPNEVDIVANYIAEAINSEAAVIYHISGPDMVRYSTDGAKAEALARLYAAAARSPELSPRLPREILRVELVPAADARLATAQERSYSLEDAVSGFQTLRDLRTEYADRRAVFFKGADRGNIIARDSLIGEEKRVLKEGKDRLAEVLLGCSYLFDDYREQPFISQYDVSSEGGLYVSPLNRSLAMSELSKITKEIRKILEVSSNEPATV